MSRARPARPLAALPLAGAILLAQPVAAQESRDRDLPSLEQQVGILDAVEIRARILNRFVGVADFGDAKANSNQPEGQLRISVPVARDAGLRLVAAGRVLLYDFDDPIDLFGLGATDDPFSDLNQWSLRLQGAYRLPEALTLFSSKERWSLLAEGFGKAAWEAGSDLDEGLRGGGALAVGYHLPKRLDIVAGVALQPDLLTNELKVSPIVELDWRINDSWELKSIGLGAQLDYVISKDLRVFVRGRLEGGSYRLDQRAGIGRGAISVKQLPAGIGLRWDFLRIFRLTATLGAMAYHRIRVEDQSGDEIDRITADPSPYFVLQLDLRP